MSDGPQNIIIPDVMPHSPGDDVAIAASTYGAAGLYIVAVQGKNPAITGRLWQTMSATGGPDAYALIDSRPDATGVGLHVGRSGLIEIDIDTEDTTLVPTEVLRAVHELKPPHFTSRIGAELRGGYLFRVPAGRAFGNGLGRLRPADPEKKWGDIRGRNGMCVLPGSAHPEPDGEYAWQRTGEVPELPGYLADMLPVAGEDSADSADNATVREFMDAHVSELAPNAVKGAVAVFENGSGAGRHTAAVEALCMAMREARAGLYPATAGAAAIRTAFATAVGADRDITGEWFGLLAWAVGQALAAPDQRLIEIREKALASRSMEIDEETGKAVPRRILPSPAQPSRVAEEIVRQHIPRDPFGHITAAWWRDEFYRWRGTHWARWPRPEVEGWLYKLTFDAKYFKPADEEQDYAEALAEEAGDFKSWNPTTRSIAETMNSLAKQWLQRVGDDQPVLACANGVVQLHGGEAELAPHTAERFNLAALDFDYDPGAECPQWLAFLESVLPGDAEAHDFLGEWFGYVLSGRTNQQRIASLIGKPRSGKGTILRTLESLVGRDAAVAVDITELGQQFGRATLIGKSLAIMSDVRWNSNLATEALKCLLAVSGEDPVTWARKHREDWSGRSGVRFMVASNDVPTFADRSNAIGARMIHVKFDVSFRGREDVDLESKLRAERAGILNWAIQGLRRLEARGRFAPPASGQVIAEEMERNANPVGQFVEEWCEVGDGLGIFGEELLAAYTDWARRQGMDRAMQMRTFLTALRAVGEFATSRKVAPAGGKQQYVSGLALAGWRTATMGQIGS